MDDSFTIPTEEAERSLQQARVLIQNLSVKESQSSSQFINWLMIMLSKVIDESKFGESLDCDKLWRSYHKARTGHNFSAKWEECLAQMNVDNPTPLFYQHITQELFETLITQKCSIPKQHTNIEHLQMTLEEEKCSALCGRLYAFNHGGLVQVTEDAYQLFAAYRIFCYK